MVKAEWFAGRLKELREQAGLSQQSLADLAGLSKGGIADLEQGRRKPIWETVLALAQALGVTTDAFAKEPAPATPTGPGRPRKATAEIADQGPRRPRGRSRKEG